MAGERRPVDVLITLDGRRVAMKAGDDTIGRWRRGECEFEQRGEGRYEFRAEGETLSLQVSDPTRFQRALMAVWQERRFILPGRLLGVTAGILLAMTAVTALGAARPASPAPPEAEVAPSATPTPPPPQGTVAGAPQTDPPANPVAFEPAPVTAETLAARWNAVSPSARLEVPAPGVTVLGAHLTVEIGEGTVSVEGSVTPDDVRNREVVAAMGIAIAVLDPDLDPADRKDVLVNLGLDLRGDNPDPIDRAFTHRGVEYRLAYVPGVSLALIATI